ncbi:MAG: aldo/keto reductase [Rhodospirillales bacterium]
MRSVNLPSGEAVPVLGLGTWRMGESAAAFKKEAVAVRHAYDRGIRLFDTAEMYGEGGAEKVLAAGLEGVRDDCFIVSKVYPHNASYDDAVAACERSLRRLGTDRIDLYLLHWPGRVPYPETIRAFEALQSAGKIRHYGVSNLDIDDLEEWFAAGGTACATDQVIYNPTRRGVEFDLLPWCRSRSMPVMAYSPLEQGRLGGDDVLRRIGERHGVSALQVSLAWVLRDPNIIAIPKSADPGRIDANIAALDIRLGDEDIAKIDAAFPPPVRKQSLEML